MLKDDVIKINTLAIDDIGYRELINFNNSRTNFIYPDTFPEVERHIKADLLTNGIAEKKELVKEYYFFPVIKKTDSFNPYKKSYTAD